MILCPLIRQRFFDSNGNPLAGGKLYSYTAGTTTPQATYTDQGGLTPNANPVILNANGEANVWLDDTLSYKFILQDSSGVQQWSVDQVSTAGSPGIDGWNAESNYSAGNIVADASGAGLLYVSLQNNNAGNALSSVTYWRLFGGGMRTVTANTTLLVTDELVRSNSTSGALTHTLPACSTTPIGKRITIKDVGTGGFTTTVKGGGTDTVDGTVTYGTALRANESLQIKNTGSRWDVISLNHPIAAGDIGTTQLADGSVTPAKRAALGQQISSSSGSGWSNATTSYSNVTNLSVTINTTGRPVWVGLISDGSGNESNVSANSSSSQGPGADFQIKRDSTVVANYSFIAAQLASSGTIHVISSAIHTVDPASAGSYTYTVQGRYSVGAAGSGTAFCSFAKLVAYEM